MVLLPDFFLDLVVTVGQLPRFIAELKRITERKGGNIPWLSNSVQKGGNATNAAFALATLGARSELIVRTSPLGLRLLRFFSSGKRIGLSHVKTDGRLASTVSLELLHGRDRVNVMINDSGSVKDFHPKSLSRSDISLIKRADYLAVLNWAQNLSGTELALHAFQQAKRARRARTFFDPSDPSARQPDISALVSKVLRDGFLDIVSLNENEAVAIAKAVDRGFRGSPVKACEVIHERTGVRLDLHTSRYSASFRDGSGVVVPCLHVRARTVTGAGDAWNAATIFADYRRLSPVDSLLFANVAAAHFVTLGTYATIEDISNNLRRIIR